MKPTACSVVNDDRAWTKLYDTTGVINRRKVNGKVHAPAAAAIAERPARADTVFAEYNKVIRRLPAAKRSVPAPPGRRFVFDKSSPIFDDRQSANSRSVRRDQLCEHVKREGPLGRAERTRLCHPTVSLERFTVTFPRIRGREKKDIFRENMCQVCAVLRRRVPPSLETSAATLFSSTVSRAMISSARTLSLKSVPFSLKSSTVHGNQHR
ncbi:hypothetical protein EVAR_65920_1 [Eumeta japonica]|uniref:Uncharacterized protein n=1 Tax=Eumeta variegata TaxID=151549 RepID=A0A4C2ABU3_EUMVA|nr:hypothetical protein EVAR_65920_1 [Eumeta japonica]